MIFLWSFASLPHIAAIALILSIYRLRNKSLFGFLVLINSLLAFLLLYKLAPWMYTSTFSRYVYAILIVVSTIRFMQKDNGIKLRARLNRWMLQALFSGILITLAWQTWIIPQPNHSISIDLSIPFSEKGYTILQGGNSVIQNPFHGRLKAQRYALDIIQVNNSGRRAKGIAPASNEKYFCFGDTLLSPVDGIVVNSKADIEDNKPGTMNSILPIGNHIIIRSGNYFIIMGHLQKQGIFVQKGVGVNKGDRIGVIGNSGRSIEPHLHLQVIKIDQSQGNKEIIPIPINFEDSFYSINERIN